MSGKTDDLKELPPLPRNAPGKPAKPGYRNQYGVTVICPDEAAQRVLYAALKALPDCRIKVVVT